MDGDAGKRDNRKRVLRIGTHASNMSDINRKTATSTSEHAGVDWKGGKYRAQVRFSLGSFGYTKHIGYFGVKGDKSKGSKEAGLVCEKVKAQIPAIEECQGFGRVQAQG